LQRLLVHVLTNRQRLSQKTAREEQGGIPRGGEEWAASGLACFRWQFGCGLVSAHTPRWLDRAWRLRRVDDVPVWSLSCFYIRKGYRKRGVTSALIAGALKIAKSAGAPALEAYPLDADLTPSSSSTGFASTFTRAGFKIIARRTPPRPIMRRNLTALPTSITKSHG
jgi:GNAT superfamily N-acetyltransferase